MMNTNQIDLDKIIPVFKNDEIAAVYLFGSQASGKIHSHSDVDIAILFNEKLSSVVSYRRLENYFVKIARLLRIEPDVIDMEQVNLILLFEILRHGKIIVENNRDKNRDFQARKIVECIDFNYIVDMCARGMHLKAKEKVSG